MAIKHHTIPPLGTVDAIDQPQWAEAHDIDSGGLTFSDSSVQTTAAAGANPSAKVGLAAVNGVASSFMRSDGAPALDVSITPTWTGAHVFNSSVLVGAATGGAQGAGTVNATGLFVNGVAVTTGAHPTGANPTASVGLTAVNGSAATFMRSDGAPALSQAIIPTWTGTHTFNPASGNAIVVNGVSGSYAVTIQGNGANPNNLGLLIQAGSGSGDAALAVLNAAAGTTMLEVFGDGHSVMNPTSGITTSVPTLRIGGLSTQSQGFVGFTNNTTATNLGGIGGGAVVTGQGVNDIAIWATNNLVIGTGSGTQIDFQISSAHAISIAAATGSVGFYGKTPAAQRATTSIQRTSNLSTVTGTISVSTAAVNQVIKSLQEVMNTLAAYGLWSIS